MKARMPLICSVLAAVLALAACTSAAGQASVTMPCEAFRARVPVSKEARVKAGETFKVSLCANPSTGYAWEEAKVTDPAVLAQVERGFVAPKSNLPGAPGSEVWTFKGLQKGTTTVSMDYSEPWEGGDKGLWTFSLTVTVE